MMEKNVYSYFCQEPASTGFRETAQGYDLSWVRTSATCEPLQRLQAIEHVDRAGRVTLLRTNVVEHEASACVADESLIRPVP
jgi:hypothetical protein